VKVSLKGAPVQRRRSRVRSPVVDCVRSKLRVAATPFEAGTQEPNRTLELQVKDDPGGVDRTFDSGRWRLGLLRRRRGLLLLLNSQHLVQVSYEEVE